MGIEKSYFINSKDPHSVKVQLFKAINSALDKRPTSWNLITDQSDAWH